ncbi:endonuclease [Lampropedia cohaerens]|uniref:Endonuclease n=1 Tax=Lampropedia cohaerens TaxID=1610491 RepID=A0A0U1Q2H5_9BURK|nr:endonuclease/exonuclease/phosphatase family protein [Lampropedia cohaerens]KKW68963.1 endonuclease [Lampropedia cohaerens]
MSRARVWWVRVWDFPRAQLAVLLAAVLVLQVLLLDRGHPANWGVMAATLAALVYQLCWILPYTRLWRPEVRRAAQENKAGPRLRMLTANVLTPNRNAAALLALVREQRPDILVTLESDAWWQQQLEPLEREYPYRVVCPLDNLYDMHVYSRLPLHGAEVKFLVEQDVPSVHASVLLQEEGNGQPQVRVRMHFLHPAPPSPAENEASTERDVELILVAKSLEKERGPVVVTGDLNDVAWSPTTRLFRKLSGLLDPRVGRGMINSFHASYWFARWPLDHFFHSDHFELVQICRLPNIGSDHFPVLIELQYHPANRDLQIGLQANAHDRRDVAEVLKLAPPGAPNPQVPAPPTSAR